MLHRANTLLIEAGADALVVRCDSGDTSSGIADLFCVTQAVGKQVSWGTEGAREI